MTSLPLPYLGPLVLLALAALALRRPGRRPGALPRWSEYGALLVLGLAVGGLLQLLAFGPARHALAPFLSLRLDGISATMGLLVGFVGWIVLRYSRSYLDGEAREGAFHGLMLATLAGVLLLVQAGSLGTLILGFVAVGIGLRALLLFYPERAEARRAAAKFTLVWGAGDLALALAALLLWHGFGTAEIAGIKAALPAQGPLPLTAQLAVAALVLAAALKTAAVPLHGWLTEVMEAPTPVSALLHAGVINAGGVLLILLAPLIQASPGAMAALTLLGGFTALFGAAVMLTQSAVKTALAWSTISQMGFMLLQCGLGLWALALLHIVAHSLYKAHGFLSSGAAVEQVAAIRRPGPVAVPGAGAVLKSFALALALFSLIAAGFALIDAPKPPQALALGAMLIFGVAYLVAQGLADRAPQALTKRTLRAALGATLVYFAFQALAGLFWGGLVPQPPQPTALDWALITLAVLSFGAVAIAQTLFPLWAHHPASAGWRVHMANGLYLNALFDRIIGGLRHQNQN